MRRLFFTLFLTLFISNSYSQVESSSRKIDITPPKKSVKIPPVIKNNPNSFTLSRAIQYLSGDAETPRQYLMAGSVIVTLPVLFIFVYFEKYLVSGLTAGSVKG